MPLSRIRSLISSMAGFFLPSVSPNRVLSRSAVVQPQQAGAEAEHQHVGRAQAAHVGGDLGQFQRDDLHAGVLADRRHQRGVDHQRRAFPQQRRKRPYDGSFMATTIVASSTMGEPICRWPILTWQWAVPPRTSAP